MVFILTLPAAELDDNLRKFYTEERLTKAFPKSTPMTRASSAPILLVLRDANGARNDCTLAWMGVRVGAAVGRDRDGIPAGALP